MKKLVPFLLLTMLFAEYALILSTVQAQADPLPDSGWLPYIRIYDENGNLRKEFVKGETIRIVTYFPSPIYKVYIIDPDGQVRYDRTVKTQWGSPDFGKFDSGLLEDMTDKIGSWKVVAGVLISYKIRTYHVIAVAPLGIIGMLAACFTGLGLKSFRIRKQDKH